VRNDDALHAELVILAKRFNATSAFLVVLYPCVDDPESTEAATVAVMHPDADSLASVAMLQRELADYSLGLAVQEQGRLIAKVEVDRTVH